MLCVSWIKDIFSDTLSFWPHDDDKDDDNKNDGGTSQTARGQSLGASGVSASGFQACTPSPADPGGGEMGLFPLPFPAGRRPQSSRREERWRGEFPSVRQKNHARKQSYPYSQSGKCLFQTLI